MYSAGSAEIISNPGGVGVLGRHHSYHFLQLISTFLGLGDTSKRLTSTLVTAGGLSSVSVVDIATVSAGDNFGGSFASHSLVLSSLGSVFGFGLGTTGQLGLGTSNNRFTPTLTQLALSTLSATTIVAGAMHSIGKCELSPLSVAKTF